jgi:hypothetical protein
VRSKKADFLSKNIEISATLLRIRGLGDFHQTPSQAGFSQGFCFKKN